MNVYDFDKTITDKDSSYLFIKYALAGNPRAFVDSLEEIGLALVKYLRSGDKDPSEMKEALFRVVSYIPDIDAYVAKFWDSNRHHIKQWYLDRMQPTDIIISASPEFLVGPIAEELGVALIATPMSKTSGCIQGINCKKEEKVRRFLEVYPDAEIDEFYSDSLSDTPMAKLAKRAWLVNGNRTAPWPNL